MSDDPETFNNQENAEHVALDLGRSAVRLFALIIGIDRYADPNIRDLDGAVADATAMKQYLVDMLRMSEHHIVELYNQRATRVAIIEAFRKLRDDERINHGDPIVIYYSGHGGRLPAPAGGIKKTIEAILPQNSLKAAPGTEPPEDRAPIPDLTIGILMEEIAKAKGDNITVIFDCCFSGSATRDNEYVPRGIHLDFNIPETLDSDILGGRTAESYDIYDRDGVKSHVLLAACNERELAYESTSTKRGQFTVALLEELQTCTSDTSYAKLLEGIRLENNKVTQHPQCIGFHRHRVLFDAKVLAGSHVFHPAQGRKGGEYVINAGFAHGVKRGVEFTLYDDTKKKLCVAPVDETSSIEDFKTVIKTLDPLTGVSLAKLTRVGKIPLYVDNDRAAIDVLQRSDGYGTDAQQFLLVKAEEANLGVGVENDRVIFRTLDKKVKELGLTKLPHAATRDNIVRVLRSAARYYWFLGLAEQCRETSRDKVALDFCLLDVDHDEYGLPLFSEGEYIFSRRDPNSRNSDVIDFVVNPEAVYGLKVTNNTSRDLYLNVFLFNNSDLSIVSYYTRPSDSKTEAPLKKKGGTFTVGYGTDGTFPFTFKLEKGQDMDVGQLKIVFATRPIDLSDITQRSPFSKEDGREVTDEDEDGRGEPLSKFKAVASVLGRFALGGAREPWFTLDIPLVQRREAIVKAV